jgi:hypothetical protein
MAMSLEQARENIVYHYKIFLREHIGLTHRHDICLGLEYLVWMRTRHPTLLDFADSRQDKFCKIVDWLGLQKNQN